MNVERCVIVCDSMAAVEIYGPQATGMLRHNTILDGPRGPGVLICDGAQVTLSFNDVSGCFAAGVSVEDAGTTALLFDNFIRDGRDIGIGVDKGASAVLERNTVMGNDLTGLEVFNSSTADLVDNVIRDNGHALIPHSDNQLDNWVGNTAEMFKAGNGFPGVWVTDSVIKGKNNRIEGNNSRVEQVLLPEGLLYSSGTFSGEPR